MAGYTAANNIFGFLYVSVNSVTQACMSFTSQNYGVRKPKRMDRVLVDCMILSFVVSFAMGCGAYFFGPQLLKIYTEDPKVIQCGMEILVYTTVTYFLCGQMDLFPGALRGMGRSGVPMILSIIGTVGLRIVWIFRNFPGSQITESTVYFLSGILDPYDHHAGDLFLVCKAESSQAASGRDCRIKIEYTDIRKADRIPLFCVYREK